MVRVKLLLAPAQAQEEVEDSTETKRGVGIWLLSERREPALGMDEEVVEVAVVEEVEEEASEVVEAHRKVELHSEAVVEVLVQGSVNSHRCRDARTDNRAVCTAGSSYLRRMEPYPFRPGNSLANSRRQSKDHQQMQFVSSRFRLHGKKLGEKETRAKNSSK